MVVRLLAEGDSSFNEDITVDAMKWFETPSVIFQGADRYQVVGRVVHMDFVQEHLRTKKNVNFGNSQERSNNIELEVMADTIYIKGRYLQMFQTGSLNILTNGGNGEKKRDQNGQEYGKTCGFDRVGQGNGGNAGHQNLNVRRVKGKLELKTCRGSGAQAATNGKGGKGNRADASALRKVAKRRLGFLNKDGFDRFGNNKMYATLSKCVSHKKRSGSHSSNAQSYEDAYNDVKVSIERQDDLKKVLQALPAAASIQVRAQKDRTRRV
ncbi:hypothetical protein OS493_020131 [Desmophyllum pertusum]|uniref:Uncharacterized protein n=1 Tax=Desmophyllum pertusum TaxID=174260 RepID=A0A9X0D948_9CNID|nr:hypothetical protein OS493_020131 [Desmophyllum pertusum]